MRKIADMISTGFSRFDEILGGGICPGELIAILSHPAEGKTGLAISLMITLARRGIKSLYLSFEMGATILFPRIISISSEIPLASLSHMGRFCTDEDERFADALRLDKSHVYRCMYMIAPPIDEVSAAIRSFCAEHEPSVIFVDYLDLIRWEPGAQWPDTEEKELIAAELKKAVEETGTVIILLHQVGRMHDICSEHDSIKAADTLLMIERDISEKELDIRVLRQSHPSSSRSCSIRYNRFTTGLIQEE